MARLQINRDDLLDPEESEEMKIRLEPAPDGDWRFSEDFGYREPSPHFHVITKGFNPDTSERIACIG